MPPSVKSCGIHAVIELSLTLAPPSPGADAILGFAEDFFTGASPVKSAGFACAASAPSPPSQPRGFAAGKKLP